MAHEASAPPRMPSHPPPTLEPASRFLRRMIATAAAEQDVLYTVYWLRQLRDRGLLWRCTKRGIEGALVERAEDGAHPTALEAVATSKRSTLRNFILLLLLFNLEGSGKGWPLLVDTSGWQEWAQKIVAKWEYKWRACEMAQGALDLLRMQTDEEVADWVDANLPSPPNPEGLTGWRVMPPFPPQAGQGSAHSREAEDKHEEIKAEDQAEVKQEEREEVRAEVVKREPSASPGLAPTPLSSAFSPAEEHKPVLFTAPPPQRPAPSPPPAAVERRRSFASPAHPAQSHAPPCSASPPHAPPRPSRLPLLTRPPVPRSLPLPAAAPSRMREPSTGVLPLPPSAGLGPDHSIDLHLFRLAADTTVGDITDLFRDLGMHCSAVEVTPLAKYGARCYLTVPDRVSWAKVDSMIRSHRIRGHIPLVERLHPTPAQRFTPQHPTVLLEGFSEKARTEDVERLARRARCGLYGADLEWAGEGKRGRVRASSPDTAERVCRMLDGVELPAEAGGGRVRASWRKGDALAASTSAFSSLISSALKPSSSYSIAWGAPFPGWEHDYQQASPPPPSRTLPSPPPSNRSPSPSLALSSAVLSSPPGHAFPDVEREEIVLEPTRLYVGGLAVGTSKDAVLRMFAHISVPVLDIVLKTSYEPTSAFVTVPSPSSASLAISSLHCSTLRGSRLKVEHAFEPSEVFTRPRIRLSNLPQTFDAGDLLRLVRPHVAQPMDVQCTASCGVGGSCEGSFRVKDVPLAERVVKALGGLTLGGREVGVECEALAKRQPKAPSQSSAPDRPPAMRERDAGWGARGKGRSRSPPTRRPAQNACLWSSALVPTTATLHVLSHPLPPRPPPQRPQFTTTTAERRAPPAPAPIRASYTYSPPAPPPQPDY
ncbi:hypothetical protein JCM10213v2_005186 [Rhodosporidiobolus nylandii]